MGPTNIALVKLFRADQALREAQERLDAATKNVRVQDRRVADLAEKLRLATAKQKELQTKASGLDLDLRSRDAHIEKLRTQQQSAKNNKEYQTFLIEINTHKVDKTKVEEEAVAVMEQGEAAAKEVAEMTTQLQGEQVKAASLKESIGGTITTLQAEIDTLKGPREAVAATLPPKARIAFERMAEHHDGEAMAAIMKPDRRKEEYACSGCMMDLVTDVYNRLHSRDEMIVCPSCRRLLYIPDDLPPELAVHKKKSAGTGSAVGEMAPAAERPPEAPRAKGRVGEILTAAQGESVKNAIDADHKPVEFHVTVDGRVVGIYKGKNAENLERIIKFRFDEAGLKHEVHVNPVVQETPAAATAEPAAPPAGTEPITSPTTKAPAATEPATA